MKNCIPKTFLWRFPLTTGASIFGIIMIIVKILCLSTTIKVMVDFSQCNAKCTNFVANNSYGFNVTAMIYFVVMILVHLCFIWAVKKKHSTVIIGWVAVTTIWLLMSICVTVVLLCLYSKQTSSTISLVCVIFAIIGFCIAVYGVLIAIGLWKEILAETTRQNP